MQEGIFCFISAAVQMLQPQHERPLHSLEFRPFPGFRVSELHAVLLRAHIYRNFPAGQHLAVLKARITNSLLEVLSV